MSTPAEQMLNWGDPGAPEQFRQAHEAQQAELKRLKEEAEAKDTRLAAIDRRERVDALVTQLGDVAKDVTAEDFADMAPDQITPTLVQAKAIERQNARDAALTQLAKDAGFDSVEALNQFRTEADARKAAEAKTMTASAVTAGAGAAPPEVPKSPGEDAIAAFRDARVKGLPTDEAENAFIGTLFQRQIEALEASPK